jgi:nitroreductase
MELLEAIRTTRAMRRLDPSRDVSDADLETILFAATKAPSAKNEQPVRWIVVKDAKQRRRLGEIYERVSKAQPPMATPDASAEKLARSVDHLVHHLGDAPVLVVACAYGADDVRTAAGVYPAVQNLMLAARSLGLGTTLTTRHRLAMAETRAVLDLPEDVTIHAVVPVGYPLGRWGEAPRVPVRDVAHRDRWGTPFVADDGG